MAKREISEINAGSMADIAFLLLIFFLVTTTMDTDTGLIRKLPPIQDKDVPPPPKIKERNIFEILVNANDQLLVEGEYMEITDLKDKTKAFIRSNPSFPSIIDASNPNYPNLPEFKQEDIPVFGPMYVSKQIVSLQNDNGTSYHMYIKVQNELVRAYKEVRNELAVNKFGKSYEELLALSGSSESIKDQVRAIKKAVPQRISEAEPKNVGGDQ